MPIQRADYYTVNAKTQVKFSDFLMNFDVNPDTGDLYRNINDNAIRAALKNIILTDLGEVPFQPDMGSNIRHSQFENLTDQSILMLKKTIEIAINNNEPRVVLRDLSVVPDYDSNQVTISIFYTTINSPGQLQELNVSLLIRVR
jgi:phage baseplate assembly protein W